jgi:hypothetical protein
MASMRQLLLGQTILGIALVGPVIPAAAQIANYNNNLNWFQSGRRASQAPVNAENGIGDFFTGAPQREL